MLRVMVGITTASILDRLSQSRSLASWRVFFFFEVTCLICNCSLFLCSEFNIIVLQMMSIDKFLYATHQLCRLSISSRF